MQFSQACPCGSGPTYDACCGRLHRGAEVARTPEELMRSRYTAYALGECDYVFRTWHPRTRPDDVTPIPALRWTGLEIVATEGDTVECRAHFRTSAGEPSRSSGHHDVLHEVSRFEQRAGRWVYVERLS